MIEGARPKERMGMKVFLSDTLLFISATANHVFLMMYWVWLPGLFLSALLHARYRRRIWERCVPGGGALSSYLYAVGLGLTASLDQRRNLEEARALIQKGTTKTTFGFLVASRNLPPYALSFITLLVGLEFFLGMALGALILVGIMVGLSQLIARPEPITTRSDFVFPSPDWREGVKYIGREAKAIWPSFIYGLILAGVIAALGRQDWWIDFSTVGGGGFPTQLLNATLGSLAAVVLFTSPLGNLLIASFLWKSYAPGYVGVISFILASSASPWALRACSRTLGRKAGPSFAALTFLGSILSALAVVGVFYIIGFEVTHTPLFHELVNKLMMFFSLSGRGMGGMQM